MKTQSKIIAEALRRNPSVEDATPPRTSWCDFRREDLLAALGGRAGAQAAGLLVSVAAVHAGRLAVVRREDLLEALGVDYAGFDALRAGGAAPADLDACLVALGGEPPTANPAHPEPQAAPPAAAATTSNESTDDRGKSAGGAAGDV